jgi:hypothetical protein
MLRKSGRLGGLAGSVVEYVNQISNISSRIYLEYTLISPYRTLLIQQVYLVTIGVYSALV